MNDIILPNIPRTLEMTKEQREREREILGKWMEEGAIDEKSGEPKALYYEVMAMQEAQAAKDSDDIFRQKQANFIAAYTGRRKEDIDKYELDNPQRFWNAHPEATADVIRGRLYNGDANVKNLLQVWLESGDFIAFYGADLKEAYENYTEEDKKLIIQALKETDNILSRRYIKADILPDMERSFIQKLEPQTIFRLKAAFNTTHRPPASDTSTFWLFCTLFDLADDDRKAQMAAAIGTEPELIEAFIQSHEIPEPIIFGAEPKQAKRKTDAEQSDAEQSDAAEQDETGERGGKPQICKKRDADANTIRQLAQYNSSSQYDVSIDTSVFTLIGQSFDKTITDSTGHADFYMHLTEREFLFPYLLEAEDILIAIAWDSIRTAGGRYITPLDIWHKIFWGVTDTDSTDSETEKKLLAKLKKGQGALQEIVERVERLMHLETIYRLYRTPKTAQPRKPADLLFEYKNTFIPYAGRAKIPGYKNKIVWETALRNPNEKWDGYTSLPYRAAVARGRLISFPAEQIDFRRLEINSTFHIATMRDTVLRLVANAQSHGGRLEIRDIDKVYEYGRLDAKRHLELDAAGEQGAEELRAVKDRQRKQRDTDAQTLARLAEGLKKTGALDTMEVKRDGHITAQTAISWGEEKRKSRKRKRK